MLCAVWADGLWSRESQAEAASEPLALPENVQRHFFSALEELATRRLTAKGEFVRDGGFFEPNDAKFVYRCPSLARLDYLEVYLDEDIPAPAFKLHFRLLLPSSLLTVTVDVVTRGQTPHSLDAQERVASELDAAAASWERLLGLPSSSDPSMIDVWHLDDNLAPRIVAETRHRDIVARFRAVMKKKRRKQGDDSDAGYDQDDSAKKGDDNDEEAEEDEEDANHDADGEGADELARRALSGTAKKKRKRSGIAELAENDDSVVPVSPDTHINSPDVSAATVRMTFPHDLQVQLHSAPEVQLYKRKRTRSKQPTDSTTALAVTFGSLGSSSTGSTSGVAKTSSRPGMGTAGLPTWLSGAAQQSHQAAGRNGTFHPVVKSEPKPTLSVAVSLVESLSHNEQQEALDARPVKTHPLLQALQDYVDNEASVALNAEIERQRMPKVKLITNAEAFIPSVTRDVCVLSAVNAATTQRLQLNLLSDRFKHWRSDYRNMYYPAKKNRRYEAKAHQQRLLLEFSEAKLEEWSRQHALQHAHQAAKDAHAIRDREIAIGTTLAASDAMVVWKLDAISRCRRSPADGEVGRFVQLKAASSVDRNVLGAQLQPFLEDLASRLHGSPVVSTPTKRKARSEMAAPGSWLSLPEYLHASTSLEPASGTNGRDGSLAASEAVRSLAIDRLPPALSVATAESSFQIAPAAISEYLLRSLHPISAPKPVDYVVVCPHSPSQWLGSLSLSHLTAFRSMYAQCNMGDMCPMDLAALPSNEYASVDATNATVLLDCANTTADAFANFRAAGELLRQVLSAGVKKQAFARSPVGNVVFLVAPFRRQDVRHKMWLLGAFARGLFGWDSLHDASPASAAWVWKDSVTVEILYLDDLFASELNPSPHVAMANCFALFDRVGEGVALTPLSTVTNGAADPQSRLRFVCERLYQVADWRQQQSARTPRSQRQDQATEPTTPCVHGGYAISGDGKWLLFACVDAVGSVCESRVVSLVDTGLVTALGRMMASLINFLTLFGEQAVLVVTRLGALDSGSSHKMDDAELFAWEDLRANQWGALLPAEGGAAALVTRVLLAFLTTPSRRELQPRVRDKTAVVVSARQGLMLQAASDDSGGVTSRVSACAAMFGARSACCAPSEAASGASHVLRLTVVRDLSLDADDSLAVDVEAILRDFYALSFLTTHPVTGARQSPLPLHLASVRAMGCELDVLESQLATDPLAHLHA